VQAIAYIEVMSKATCKRCGGGSVIARYSHVAQGVCFACGRKPVAPVVHVSRATVIAEVTRVLREMTAAGRRWETATSEIMPGVTLVAELDGWLMDAPDDVVSRARAAVARLPVALAA